MAVITISRQVGCGRLEIVQQVCRRLGYSYFDKRLLVQEALRMGLTESEIADFPEEYKAKTLLQNLFAPGSRVITSTPIRVRDESGIEKKLIRHLDETDYASLVGRAIVAAYERGNIVIVGRGAQVILKDRPGVLHVRLIAPLRVRVKRIQEREGWDEKKALEYIQERDRAIAEYMEQFHWVKWDDPELYHITINTDKCGLEESAQIIIEAVRRLEHVASVSAA